MMVLHAETLWQQVVGQDQACAQLQAAINSPVHAYLLVGPPGTGKRAAALAFAAELLSHESVGAESEQIVRLVSMEQYPALNIVEREGPSISADQARDVVGRSQMSPPVGSRQVFILDEFHLVQDAGPMLLKAIEEPNPGTFFIVLADEVPSHLETIASRCVEVNFTAIPEDVIARALIAEGSDPELAGVVASISGGNLERARLIVADPSVTQRRDAWYSAMDRVDGTGHAITVVVDELLASIEAVLQPLEERQKEELEAFVASFENLDLSVPKGQKKQVEDRHKREQRRIRADELRSGLGVLLEYFRDRCFSDGPAAPPALYTKAYDAVRAAEERLHFNAKESLVLQSLFIQLSSINTRDD